MIELMNLAADGTATSGERRRLDEYLSAHPEARSYYEALTRLVNRLEADPIPDPPAGFESRILDAIHRLPVPGPAPHEATPSSWRRGFFAPRLRPWSTFGLGLATGLFILAIVQYSRPGFWDAARDISPSDVSGSMTGRLVEPISTIPVETAQGTVSGSAVIYGRGTDIMVDVKLQSTIPVEWTVSFDPDAWSLDRVERHGTATSAFAASRGSVQGLHTGEGGVTLVFHGAASAAKAVVLKVLQGGEPVFEGTPSSTQ
ncbi:MAG TPA: hypothetical protein VF247_04620 [Candidatus Krumholzibacteria bacterium]